MKSPKPIKQVKSAIRTMQLFGVFAQTQRPLSLAELTTLMDSPKSSCHELLQSLLSLGYILAIDGGKSYYPSRRLLETAEQICQYNPIKERIQNKLKHLRDITGETVFIGRLQGTQAAYLEVFDGTHAVRYTARSGDTKEVHASALGKALLANLDEAARERFMTELTLTKFTEHTFTKKKAFKEHLEQSMANGIFTSVGENIVEVMGIAMPLNIQGHQLAIGMAGPLSRMEKNLSGYKQALNSTIKHIAGG